VNFGSLFLVDMMRKDVSTPPLPTFPGEKIGPLLKNVTGGLRRFRYATACRTT
jgi:hypothetical protein